MEDFTILQEILFVMESLLSLIWLFVISNTFFLKKIRKIQDKPSGILIRNVVAAMFLVPFFLLFEQVLTMSGRVDFSGDSHLLFPGTMLLLYFPIFWFMVKRNWSFKGSYLFPSVVSSVLLAVNIVMVLMVDNILGNHNFAVVISSVMNLLLILAISFNLYLLKDCFKVASAACTNNCDFRGGVLSLVGPYPFLLLFVFVLTFILPDETLGHLSVISVTRIFTVMVNIALLRSMREVILNKIFYQELNVCMYECDQDGGNSREIEDVVKYDDHLAIYEEDEELFRRLMDFFEPEKPYLNPKLTINELAITLYTNKTYLSSLINRRFKMNFSQFLNHYRVKEAQKVFMDNPNLSLKALCEMSGFGSMASFNIAFRLFSGSTPAEWCREQKIKMRNKGDQGDVMVDNH